MTTSPALLIPPLGPEVDRLLSLALAEDLGAGDVTSRLLVPPDRMAGATIFCREPVVACGLVIVERLREIMRGDFRVRRAVREGEPVAAGGVLCRLEGRAADILAAERLMLNLLQRMTGIATITRAFRQAMGREGCELLETRKTVPGFRALDKYAVRAGGGHNHRLGLFDQILAKENHFALAGCDRQGAGFREAVENLLRCRPAGMRVEIEVETLDQLAAVIDTEVDIVLLDNMDPATVAAAVALRAARGRSGRPLLEASGGITLENIARFAAAGVDRISVGALTHSVRAPDLSLLFDR